MTKMLAVSEVNQFYGETHILWDVALTVEDGGCTCLMGRNGVGKTTFLKVLMGLLPARSGSIKLGDVELLGNRPEWRARMGVGYVPQGREIFPQLDVEENLTIGLTGAPPAKRRAAIERLLEIFPILKTFLRRRGGDLSGGQQQQLAIARALALEPRLLILDEPTEGIQPNLVHEIGDLVCRLNREQGLSVLLVEQKLAFARKVAQRFVIMDRGRTVAGGDMQELTDVLVHRHLTV